MASPKKCKFCGNPIGERELFSSYIKYINKKKEISLFHEDCYAEFMREMGEDAPFDK